MLPRRPRGKRFALPYRLFMLLLAAVPVLIMLVMVVGGYFDRRPTRWLEPTGGRQSELVAVYFSGDMGLSVGLGEGVMAELRARGVPVLAVNCSLLFRQQRNRDYARALVAEMLARALAQSGARRAVLMGGSFGADVIDTGIDAVPARLRASIASVVLIVPGTEVFYHANPTGLFYSGPLDADPRAETGALRDLPLTCIYGRDEPDSLCRMPELARAHIIAIPDGHLMLRHYHDLARAAADAATNPPPPFQ